MTLAWIKYRKSFVLVCLISWSVLFLNPVWGQNVHKPGAGIVVVSPTAIHLNLGVAQDVVVAFSRPNNNADVSLSLSALPQTLNTEGSAQTWRFRAGEKIEIPLTLLASANGRYHLKFVARVISNGKLFASTTGLAVQVGEIAATKMQKATLQAQYHVMQAQETIVMPTVTP